MEDKDSLLELKSKLNGIPDEILKELWIGIYEDNDLTFIWEDENSPTTDKFDGWKKRYPQLGKILLFIQSAYKIREALESTDDKDHKWQEDMAYMRFED